MSGTSHARHRRPALVISLVALAAVACMGLATSASAFRVTASFVPNGRPLAVATPVSRTHISIGQQIRRTRSHRHAPRGLNPRPSQPTQPTSPTQPGNPPDDSAAPNTSISSGPGSSTASTTARFAFASTESGSSFQCKLDSASWASCSSPKTYSGLAVGSHQFSVRASDAAGNTDASPATYDWTVTASTPPADTTAPDTSIASGPAPSTASTAASFSFTSTESGSSFQCKLDSATWTNCGSPKGYTGLAVGSHLFSVRATDRAGNTDASPATYNWTVTASTPPADTTAPDTSIGSGPGSSTTATSARFVFTSTESGSTFQCSLDTSTWTSCSSPKSYAGLAVGSHAFSVRATDSSGNTDASPATYNWAVASPPVEEPPVEEPPAEEPETPVAGCNSTVSSVSAAQSALSSASAGQVVCLANGTYGGITLGSSKAAPGVTLQAANPGGATIGSVQVNASGYKIARFLINGEVSIARNVDRTVVDHNRILAGNHYGVFVCTAEPPDQCDDTAITNNIFDGAMNEDQIRANVYHDGNGDGIGLLVEGNEFRGNTERGGHNDAFQTVWVGDHLVFRKNYLHDFGGQGFFVKDQNTAINGFIADNNLIVRQDLPCEPASLCTGYQLSPWQIYGPIADGEMNHNTVAWGGGGGTAVLTGTYTNMEVSSNVFNDISLTNGGGSVPSMSGSNNTYCESGGWSPPPGSTKDCSPAFLDPANNDYRLANGRGVNWTPAEMHYGP